MGKKKPDPSLKGKKPVNTAKRVVAVKRNPGHISNKLKRSEMYGKYLQEKKARKRQARFEREKQAQSLGEDDDFDDETGTPKKKTPRTLDNTRDVDMTMVMQDPEVAADEAEDEFAPYFHRESPPKVLVTTRPRPSRKLFFFIADLQKLIPGLHFYPRQSFSVKEICQFASNRNFTHVIVLSENAKHCNGMTISHVAKRPRNYGEDQSDDDQDDNKSKETNDDSYIMGPTAFFKVSSVVTSQDIPNRGNATTHIPELNLHGFGTRLGHRIGRFLGSLFPHDAQFQGRQVVTFHNQRDYIFVRHHRYIFQDKKTPSKVEKGGDAEQSTPELKDRVKARLQELGPRFTLKLRWLQEGSFDTKFGEYEWIHKRKEMDKTRRTFHL